MWPRHSRDAFLTPGRESDAGGADETGAAGATPRPLPTLLHFGAAGSCRGRSARLPSAAGDFIASASFEVGVSRDDRWGARCS